MVIREKEYPKKNIVKEIALIKKLGYTRKVRIEFKNGNFQPNGLIYLKKNADKGFSIEIKSHSPHLEIGERKEFLIKNKQLTLKISDSFINLVGSTSKISISGFSDSKLNLSKKYYVRKVIPLSKEMSFHNIIEEKTFTTDDKWLRKGLVEVVIEDRTFHIFFVDNNNKYFLFIDCIEKITHNEFSELSWSILVSTGYILSYLPQEEEYYFYYRSKGRNDFSTYSYRTLRSTLKNFYMPIFANPHAWIKDYNTAKRYTKHLSLLNQKQLSNLSQFVHRNDDLKAMLLLILEAMQSSLLSMPASLSVVLEALADFFYEKNSKRLKPITDPQIDREFRNQLRTILAQYKNNDAFKNGFTIVEKKLNEINSPTNREKLKAPFTILNIQLTDVDNDVIEYRNAFLHGNINLKSQNGKLYSADKFEIALRMLTLINCVVLKMIGYNGYVLNHAKIQSTINGKNIEEDFYRII